MFLQIEEQRWQTTSPNISAFHKLCVCMRGQDETDLHAVIKKGNLLKDIHMRFILYQLLKATKFLHSGNVIHRDQKPSNILLDADCLVKLCDFGLARSLYQIQEDSGNPALTEYVATRWYRAPEILLGSHRYVGECVGCILAEMLLGKPLFPGTSTINQIERIMSLIPAPSQEDILAIKSEYGASVISRMSGRQRVSLADLLPPSCPPEAVDLLHKLLIFNPEKRLTAEEALDHPYVRRFHSAAREPALDYDVILPVDDDVQLSVAEYRNKLYEMILERKNNTRRQKRETLKENSSLKPCQESNSVPTEEKKEAEPPKSNITAIQGNSNHTSSPDLKSLHTESCTQGPSAGHSGPKPKSPVYNPITHSVIPVGSVNWRTKKGQPNQEQTATSHPGTQGVSTPEFVTRKMEPRGKTAPVTRTRSFSLTQQARAAAPNNPLIRKETTSPAAVSVAAVSARLNQRTPAPQTRDTRSAQKFSRKMFQGTSNVGAAGDPKASLQSYTQAYGTISKSALQSLQNSAQTNKL
uniref:Protein kinase domain-containing protein n=1 Tax=Pyxicephalus adspersus TaxID=30357 RepID=A0AAV2ZZ10_PYXAD|nr:TPA: hypothetical protein GDO54_011583 [Pyxicephalus adspersus]